MGYSNILMSKQTSYFKSVAVCQCVSSERESKHDDVFKIFFLKLTSTLRSRCSFSTLIFAHFYSQQSSKSAIHRQDRRVGTEPMGPKVKVYKRMVPATSRVSLDTGSRGDLLCGQKRVLHFCAGFRVDLKSRELVILERKKGLKGSCCFLQTSHIMASHHMS